MEYHPPSTAKEVSKERFFDAIGRLDVHPTPQGSWPYLSEWKTPSGQIRGYSKASKHGTEKTKFFLPQ
jgi:hypothetical protein